MRIEELKEAACSLDDGELFGLIRFLADELEQRNQFLRLQLAGTEDADNAGLPF